MDNGLAGQIQTIGPVQQLGNAARRPGVGDVAFHVLQYAFFAGATIGLTYGKTLAESCEIGTRLAASTICTSGNVCPRFLPEEFGLDVTVTD